jgi:hypothetical protein
MKRTTEPLTALSAADARTYMQHDSVVRSLGTDYGAVRCFHLPVYYAALHTCAVLCAVLCVERGTHPRV